MKLKSIYLCAQCGTEAPRWSGQCLHCGAWNTLVEEVIDMNPKKKIIRQSVAIKPTVIIKNISHKSNRLITGIEELDRVLGGGFVSDAVALLVGDPGIGKSTLTLQICDRIAVLGRSVLYFSGEESIEQISGRANRLGLKNDIHLVNQNSLEVILSTIEAEKPGFVVVDSVQVMNSEMITSQSGSISQVRYVAEQLMQVAKSQKIPILLIGHVTKDGQLAGPQVLTHLVDTVLYLEGDKFHQFRLLRSTKNRFGAVDEVGVFAMQESGLMEVKNPSEIFLAGRAENPIGSVIFPAIEGTRAFLIEVQALTSYTQFGYPKRTANGFDLNRLNIIIAVLNRYANLKLDSCDIFVNVVGGLKLSEPAADLAVALAIASSKLKKPLSKTFAVMGEIGLSGEIRQVSHAEKRLKEAKKLGFIQIISPAQIKTIAQAIDKM
ncbi:DNA repair protein RadA [Candidatus Peregrinibacteria bacterium CG_4_10_14_0_2_um_filter_43_11]|nr:MAG: DNA repair protein RadA [Candidatus Peregrinibacteria bacterium CG_4_10_14_0_2_um_filter_43_11]